ncbi:DNA repair protein RecO [Sedimenticola sp.]|uniref:DNA repair protein RecO n=1 Tax=Sedimenticola sp. TaxID=1940285 RepID=UPI003D0AA1D5
MNITRIGTLSAAYLLHRRDFSNSSLLVECFTERQGRFPAIVKGVKGRGKSASGLLQPFIPLQVEWSGRGEIKSLTHYEADGRVLQLTGQALFCGFYVNELLMRLLQRNDPHEKLFYLYQQLLGRLAGSGVDEVALRYFELDMLNELGYGIDLSVESQQGDLIVAEKWYQFVQESGLIACSRDSLHATSGRALLSLNLRTLGEPGELREIRNFLRSVLGFYIGDKPLKSRELFRSAYRDPYT